MDKRRNSVGPDNPAASNDQSKPRLEQGPGSEDLSETVPLTPTITEPDPLVSGRFQIKHKIGEGGIGIAYLASDRFNDDMLVVLKALHEHTDPNGKEWIERHFQEEVKALARINHHGVVKLIDSGK